MGKGRMRAGLAFSVVGATVVAFASPADAAAVSANDDAVATEAGAALQFTVTGNDAIDLGSTSASIALPQRSPHGTNSVAGLTVTYTPDAGFTGSDVFPYELCMTYPTSGQYGGGSEQVCDTANITVTVTSSGTDSLGTPVTPVAGGSEGGNGTLGTGVGGSLPQTGISTEALLLALLGFASVGGGIACYGAGRDPARALVR
jgi:LPXTG-motif cell wall-anchored protein